MPSFAAELRDCLETILGAELPAPEGDALLFYRQRLAARNLGLVPIAGADVFSWPGDWVARIEAGDGDHAVVMFGSPSGPVHDPGGAFARGTIAEGWLVAPLDLRLPVDAPYGDAAAAGTVEALLVAPAAEAGLVRRDSVVAHAGRGLEGDRYHERRGTFSGPGEGYQLTLVQAEQLDDLGIEWERARRNVVTRGVDLNALVGRRFRIGAVACVGRRLAEPCAHLERVSGAGLLRPLVHRAGLRADILDDGTISVGDAVEPG
ncbi:MAG TPA: MOSC domain-containing protein [Gaiellaceae bacterium]|nr:MOSC domain-containing protein [Gaiellaceae bacterium]